jgi:DMSO/TMAO reductase YedYZ molybdopterin-dependent catalytic subunit
MRKWYLVMAATAGLVALGASASAASAAPHQPTVSVGGTVAAPATYSLSALQALPQTTFTVTTPTWWGTSTETGQGVSLESLVNAAQPTLPAAKNALLRVIVSVSGSRGAQRTFALGELDSSFGNHPAYLALEENGVALPAPELVVPGDSNGIRSVPDVGRITVAVENPAPTTPPEVGALTIEDGARTTVLSPAELASLPAETLTVTFAGPSGSQMHTETGPTLDEVLHAAHIWPDFNTWVAGVGSDGYIATATPAEAWVGGRPLLISLVEDGASFVSQHEGPRLIADGDVKGGRYDSGMNDLVVGDTAPFAWPW